MGFSPGEFFDRDTGEQIHWEAKANGVCLWGPGELTRRAYLSWSDARKALDQLRLLVEMHEDEE